MNFQVYIDNFQKALNEICTVIIGVYNSYQISQKSETHRQQNKHILEHIQSRNEKLCNEVFE